MSIITKEMVIKATRQIDHWVDLEEVEVAIRAILPDILEAAAKVVEVSGRIPCWYCGKSGARPRPNAGRDMTDEDPMVICCQGPPRCMLVDDEAVQAQRNGCVWCKRTIVHANGTETIIEPGNA